MAAFPELPETVDFEDAGLSLRRLGPITDYRQCQDGFPVEGRILFLAKRIDSKGDEDLILKVKIQVPHEGRNSTTPTKGPSDLSTRELEALQLFRDTGSRYVPHLVAYKCVVQGPSDPFPEGYITYTAMSKMPGVNLLDSKFWSMSISERQEIQDKFLETLAGVRAIKIEPGDKGLRNIMWHAETKRWQVSPLRHNTYPPANADCSTLVDFELWSPFSGIAGDEEKELQSWGLAQRPPSKNWWAEFGIQSVTKRSNPIQTLKTIAKLRDRSRVDSLTPADLYLFL